jgi:hypothetical protein
MTEQTQVHALVYASRAVAGIRNADLEQILVDASVHNRMHSVTGALLYDGFRFFQYIEGPLEGLDAVFERIKLSCKHADIDVLFNGSVAERHFWNWSMACRHAEASLIQRLEASRWTERAHSHLLDSSEENGGLRLLSDFWHSDPPPAS